MFDEPASKNTLAPLILRIALAVVFIYHGYYKIFPDKMDWGAKWAQELIEKDPNIKILPPALEFTAVQFAVAWGELVGGIAVLLGLLTRLAAFGLCIIQLGAIYTTLWATNFNFQSFGGGYEYNVVLVLVCFALVFSGGGKLSLDYLLFRKKETTPMPVPAKV